MDFAHQAIVATSRGLREPARPYRSAHRRPQGHPGLSEAGAAGADGRRAGLHACPRPPARAVRPARLRGCAALGATSSARRSPQGRHRDGSGAERSGAALRACPRRPTDRSPASRSAEIDGRSSQPSTEWIRTLRCIRDAYRVAWVLTPWQDGSIPLERMLGGRHGPGLLRAVLRDGAGVPRGCLYRPGLAQSLHGLPTGAPLTASPPRERSAAPRPGCGRRSSRWRWRGSCAPCSARGGGWRRAR